MDFCNNLEEILARFSQGNALKKRWMIYPKILISHYFFVNLLPLQKFFLYSFFLSRDTKEYNSATVVFVILLFSDNFIQKLLSLRSDLLLITNLSKIKKVCQFVLKLSMRRNFIQRWSDVKKGGEIKSILGLLFLLTIQKSDPQFL